MSAGKLVPDEMVAELMEKRLQQPDAQNGAIFDGYPRTADQAKTLDSVLSKIGRQIDRVVALEVPVDQLVERITGRRSCETCGQVYHLRYNPPPSRDRCSCGGQLVQRSDDTEEVVRKRYDEYKAKTEPVLDYYRDRGLVQSVDGVGSLDEVTERIQSALGSAS
jgi:adenylate kinase